MRIPLEDGSEMVLEMVQAFAYEGRGYMLLQPVTDNGEDAPYIVMRYDVQDSEHASVSPIDDEQEYERVMKWLIMQAQAQTIAREQEEAANVEGLSAEELFGVLEEARFELHPFGRSEMGEGMQVVWQAIDGWRKPRFLVDARARRAYHFMDENEYLLMVTDDDIDWESLSGIDEEMVDRARRHYGGFPTNIRGYQDGVAEVEWQINPDGRYYADEDGFGMTNDREVSLYSYIDRAGRPLVKFSHVGDDLSRLDRMRAEALKR